MPTFGYETVGTFGRVGINGVIAAGRGTPNTSGTLTKITVELFAIWRENSNIRVKCALYRDSNKTLVENSETNERTWTDAINEGWYDFDYVGRTPPAIKADETYLIAVWGITDAADSEDYFINVAADHDYKVKLSYVQELAYGEFPDMLSGVDANTILSAYATYDDGIPVPWQLTIKAAEGGYSTPNGAGVYSVEIGRSITETAHANTNFKVTGWLLDNVLNENETITVGPYSDGSAHTIQPVFTEIGNPSVSLPSSLTGFVNSDITIKATPSGGSGVYTLFNWYNGDVELQGSPTTTPSINLKSDVEGTFEITVIVTDSLGNKGTSNTCIVTVKQADITATLIAIGISGALAYGAAKMLGIV
jgi:hypothetical protein